LQEELLEHLQESYANLSENWQVHEIDEDIETSRNRFSALTADLTILDSQLPLMKESFDHLPKLLETLAWVQELFVLVDKEIEVDEKEDVEKEINRLNVCYKIHEFRLC